MTLAVRLSTCAEPASFVDSIRKIVVLLVEFFSIDYFKVIIAISAFVQKYSIVQL
jgi:hypothetical protein